MWTHRDPQIWNKIYQNTSVSGTFQEQQHHSKLPKDCFRSFDYHLNITGTHQNPTALLSSIKNPLRTITLPYKDFITFFKDDFLFRKMLVFNFRFFLHNVLFWSIFMIGIKIRAVLTLELNGLHEKVPNFGSRCPGSREIAKTQVAKVLWDTLYSTLYRR